VVEETGDVAGGGDAHVRDFGDLGCRDAERRVDGQDAGAALRHGARRPPVERPEVLPLLVAGRPADALRLARLEVAPQDAVIDGEDGDALGLEPSLEAGEVASGVGAVGWTPGDLVEEVGEVGVDDVDRFAAGDGHRLVLSEVRLYLRKGPEVRLYLGV